MVVALYFDLSAGVTALIVLFIYKTTNIITSIEKLEYDTGNAHRPDKIDIPILSHKFVNRLFENAGKQQILRVANNY